MRIIYLRRRYTIPILVVVVWIGISNMTVLQRELEADGNIPVPQVQQVPPVLPLGEDENVMRERTTTVAYPPFVPDSVLGGYGENGVPVQLQVSQMKKGTKQLYEEGFRLNSFNQMASDMISVKRSLPDVRSSECKAKYSVLPDLQPVGVVICFHNEAWSVLLRSVHSVINRSPPSLLHEIVLVDDNSDQGHLGAPLDRYLETLGGLVRVVRSSERLGLIRARLLGYRNTAAPIVVFLDSHIECFPGWLEPMVARIAEDHKAVPYPNIHIINTDTLAVALSGTGGIGTFSWYNLVFRWMHRNTSYIADPVSSPTMPGGLFAISRTWFDMLGTYDEGLDFWGAENMELSFKVWMCGGRVEVLPCSHVGHIFRHNNPIKWMKLGAPQRNAARVAEVWMDDYKGYFYETLGSSRVDVGDVEKRHDIRRRLQCHDFNWYINTVHPELPRPDDCTKAGQIRNVGTRLCLDSGGRHSKEPTMSPCHGGGGNQFWCWRGNGELWDYYHYLHTDPKYRHSEAFLDRVSGNKWSWTQEKQLWDGDQCLAVRGSRAVAVNCTSGDTLQLWQLESRKDTVKQIALKHSYNE